MYFGICSKHKAKIILNREPSISSEINRLFSDACVLEFSLIM